MLLRDWNMILLQFVIILRIVQKLKQGVYVNFSKDSGNPDFADPAQLLIFIVYL